MGTIIQIFSQTGEDVHMGTALVSCAACFGKAMGKTPRPERMVSSRATFGGSSSLKLHQHSRVHESRYRCLLCHFQMQFSYLVLLGLRKIQHPIGLFAWRLSIRMIHRGLLNTRYRSASSGENGNKKAPDTHLLFSLCFLRVATTPSGVRGTCQ